MPQPFLKLAIFTSALAACGVTLSASPLTYTGGGLGSAVTVSANGQNATVFAGQLNVTLDGNSMIAFCVDFFAPLRRQTYDNVTGPVSNYNNGGRAAWILETYARSLTSNEQAAAVQLALWDVVHDQGNGLGAGSFALVANAANTLRMAADAIVQASANHTSSNATILYNTSPATGAKAQTLIVTHGEPCSDVPEPSTYAMLGLGAGLIGVAAFRRKAITAVSKSQPQPRR